MRAEPIRDPLIRDWRTWTELAEITGWSVARCMSEVDRLRSQGCVIEEDRVLFLRLTYDPSNPGIRYCARRGCGTKISVYNPSRYCHQHCDSHVQTLLDALDTDRQLAIGESEPSPFDDLHEVCAEECGVGLDTVLSCASERVGA
jgi:hypothetical protein